MSRLVRVYQKIFGASGNNGVVGSELASGTNTGTLSNDIAVLQSLAAFATGLNAVTLTGENLPPQEEIQALFNIATTQLAYLFQEGIPEYDASTTYYNTTSISIVKKPATTQLYYSKTDANIGNALSDAVNWGLLGDLALLSNANILALSGLTGAASKIPYFTGVGTLDTINLFSNENAIINGGMGIDQRNAGASQTITAAAALAYTVDRWYAYCTGANVTGQRVAGTAPNQYNYRFTGAASVTKIGFAQRIEAANSQYLAGTTATLSIDLANSLLTTVTWVAYYANTTDTFGSLASPTKTQIATGTFTVSSTLTGFTTNITIPSAATTGIQIEVSVGAQISGTFTIGRVQLEEGSVATPFEQRDIGLELVSCQRYFEILGGLTTNEDLATGAAQSTTSAYGSISYKVEKRATPIITFSASNKFRFNNATSNYVSSAVSAGNQTTKTFIIILTIAGVVPNTAGMIDAVDTTGTISISSEL